MTFTFSNIILWRHAEAELVNIEQGKDDIARELTKKGQSQAKQMARWLKHNLPEKTIVLCSPALRAFQTAEALKYKIIVNEALKPSASLQEVLDCLIQLEASKGDVLIVGHQPWLGLLASHLLGFIGAEVSIKKGATWWLRQSSTQPSIYKIISVQVPSFLPR